MIDREAALRVVREELERQDRRWSAVVPEWLPATVTRVEEHELVWIFHWNSEEFVRTGNPSAALAGNGPYLVDRVDGGLHQIGVVSARGGDWEADYRVRVRGQTVRTPVDDLHDEIREVAAAHGRVRASRTLRRRLPKLSPAQSLEYVGALLDGGAPDHLVAVAVERLVQPVNPVLTARTIRPGHPRPAGATHEE
ncbi:YrhB domain-containing protein [Streptomyces sp. enrichment culture]|uniref:YrhB domain-containing protein n=1 Tax=Streptomyces sp. enrichment culture TaxID=1795815 RepID=UPI003F57DBFA